MAAPTAHTIHATRDTAAYSRRRTSGVLSFPNPVNEVAARVVAGGVVILSASAIALQLPWLTAVIAYGFLARVASGPTLSPLGQRCANVPGEWPGPA